MAETVNNMSSAATQDLAGKLADMVGKSGSVPAPTPAPAPSVAKTARTPVDAEARQKRALAASNVATSLSNKRANISPSKQRLFEAMAKHTYIAGYITNFNEKTDFSSKKIKTGENGPEAYHIALRMSAPSAIQGVIIMEPVELKAYFEDNKFNVPENSAKIQALFDKPFGDPSMVYTPRVLPWDEVIKYMLDYTNGRIKEHPDIVEEYTKGGKKPVRYSAGADDSSIFASVRMAASSKTPKLQVKHSFRSRIVTPNNFISLKRYKVVVPSTTYTPEDAKAHIAAYLTRFTKESKSSGKIPMGNLSVDCNKNFTVASGGKVIEGSTYFAVAGTPSWFSDSNNSIDHWYQKDAATGSAAKVPANAIRLVEKYEKQGKEKVIIATASEELGSANAASNYKFDQATYGTIIALTKNGLTREKLSVKKAKMFKTADGKEHARVSSVFKGEVLAGLTEEEILASLKSSSNI